MFWLIALGVVAVLAVLPVGITARYDVQGPLVRLIAGPVRILLYPRKKKDKQAPKKQKPPKPAEKKQSAAKKQGGSMKDFKPLAELVLETLANFKSKLRVNLLELKVILAGDDPSDLAVNYGRACAALGSLTPQLERFFVIKKRSMEVECDFTCDKTLIYARLDATITLGRLLALVTVYGVRILREYLRMSKLRKGGAKL